MYRERGFESPCSYFIIILISYGEISPPGRITLRHT